jgi:hypothetical protein
VTAADLTLIEDRLRAAYQDAAGTVRPADISPQPPDASPSGRRQPGSPGRARLRVAAPLAAVLAVLLIVLITVIIPNLTGASRRPPQDHRRPTATPLPGGIPRFSASIPESNFWVDIRNSATGRVTDAVPVPKRPGGTWCGLTAEAGGSFVAVETTPGDPSMVYRIRPSAAGTSATLTRIAELRNTGVTGISVSADGTWLAYQDLYMPRRHPSQLLLGLMNLRTGRTAATWSMPLIYNLSGLSVDAAGNEIAVSAYYYLGNGNVNAALVQHTYILRPGGSDTQLQLLPGISNQAGPLALSPDGKTLYEVLQGTGLSTTSFRSHKAVTFELAAISTATGKVTAVLHRWRGSYQNFVPMLALDPAGRYLLVVDRTAMATLDLRTGRYTALPAKLSPAAETQSHPGWYGGGPSYPFNAIAW